MGLERFDLRVTSREDGVRLDTVLGSWLPLALARPLSKSAVRRLVMAGAIWLDGRPLRRPTALLRAGQRLEAAIDTARLLAHAARPSLDAPGAAGEGAPEVEVATLFEDRWLLAVAKPAGLQVHVSADRSRPDLFSLVRQQLWRRARAIADSLTATAAVDDRRGQPYLALHHRLDIGTSGVVLFAIDPAANRGLSRAFAEHRVEKIYEAITGRPARVPADGWISRGPLAVTGTGRAGRVRVVPNGQAAETAFSVVRRFDSALVIEARPSTGRKHQVRAHLAEAGLPILGDPRYGGAESAAGIRVPRVMLHAAALRLDHPVTGEPLDIRCPRPTDFAQLIEALARGQGAPLDSAGASR